MANKYSQHFGTRVTDQHKPIPGTTQVPNSEGGYVWAVDDWTRLDRFLILGTEKGTYYVKESHLTLENAEGVLRCLKVDPERAVHRIAEISSSGRAPKNDAAIFALAMASAVPEAMPYVTDVFNDVVRIGTHLFQFCESAQAFRGWGRSMQRLIANWYFGRSIDQLAYQVIKYPQRQGWSHKDVLRLGHVVPGREGKYTVENNRIVSLHDKLFHWVKATALGDFVPDAGQEDLPVGKYPKGEHVQNWHCVTGIPLLEAMNELKAAPNITAALPLIKRYRMPREAVELVHTEWLSDANVWEALLEDMPMTALIRNLARMTASGFLQPMSANVRKIVEQLGDKERVRKARIHPIAALSAMKVYAQGHGERGQLIWDPNAMLVDALDGLFYNSYDNVEPSGRARVCALDVSSSMIGQQCAGIPGLDTRTASAALALVTLNREPNTVVVGFTAGPTGRYTGSNHISELKITPKMRLDHVINYINGVGFGGTDCALPMLWAKDAGIKADSFEIWTDNETHSGTIHASQALVQYRQKSGKAAKCVVVGMASNGFTIADPNDRGMLDVVGTDAAVPNLITSFIKE